MEAPRSPAAFLPSSWKQGFASEAVRCVIDHAFDSEGIDELIAVTQTGNESSCRLLERLGMKACEQFEEFGEQQTLYRAQRPTDNSYCPIPPLGTDVPE